MPRNRNKNKKRNNKHVNKVHVLFQNPRAPTYPKEHYPKGPPKTGKRFTQHFKSKGNNALGRASFFHKDTKTNRFKRFNAPMSYGSTVTNSGGTGIRIRNKEFLATLAGSTTTSIASFIGQPGDAVTHPWLYPLAGMFEEYRYHRVMFEYIGSCPSTSTGTVIAYYEYDVTDTVAPTVAEFSANQDAAETSIWNKRMRWSMNSRSVWLKPPNKYFTRAQDESVIDVHTYDSWVFNIMTNGQENTNAVGNLWIYYDIEFRTPQVPNVGIGLGAFHTFDDVTPVTNFGQLTNYANYSPCYKINTTQIQFRHYYEGQVVALCTGTTTFTPATATWTLIVASGSAHVTEAGFASLTNGASIQVWDVRADQGAILTWGLAGSPVFNICSIYFYPNIKSIVDPTQQPKPIHRIIGKHPQFVGANLMGVIKMDLDQKRDRPISTPYQVMTTIPSKFIEHRYYPEDGFQLPKDDEKKYPDVIEEPELEEDNSWADEISVNNNNRNTLNGEHDDHNNTPRAKPKLQPRQMTKLL